MVYVDPTIPLPTGHRTPFPSPLFTVPPKWPASLNSLGTWHFLPAPTDLLISHFDTDRQLNIKLCFIWKGPFAVLGVTVTLVMRIC